MTPYHFRGLFRNSVLISPFCLFFIVLPTNAFAASQTEFGSSVATEGTGEAWTNISNILADDDTAAEVDLNDAETSVTFKVTDFGFSIPTDSEITGIKVEVEKRADMLFGFSYDVSPKIYPGGTSPVNGNSDPWPSTFQYATQGGTTDLWNHSGTWTAADINSIDFGFSMAVTTVDDYNLNYVDAVKITVYYSPPPPTVTLSFADESCSSGDCPQDFGECGAGMPGTGSGNTGQATITFSEAMQAGDFTLEDISVSGGSAIVSNLQTSDNTTYTVDITSESDDALITLSVSANAARAAVGGAWNIAAGPLDIRWGENYWALCDGSGMGGLHWELDESAGTTAADTMSHGNLPSSPGTLESFSSTLPDAWRECPATTDPTNLGSLRFDGTDDVINGTSWALSNPMVFALWAQADAAYPVPGTLLQVLDGNEIPKVTIMYRPDKNHYLHVSTATDAAISTLPITLTEWNHILVEVENGDITALLVNGTNALATGDTTYVETGNQASLPLANVRVGARIGENNSKVDHFSGLIDDVWLLGYGQYTDVADAYGIIGGTKNTSCFADGGGGDPVPFFPFWALPLVLIGGVWVLKREGLLWR